jgi:predicted metal-dependent phosphoesterase TrpH
MMKNLKFHILLAALFITAMSGYSVAQVQNSDVYEFPALKQMKILNLRVHVNLPDLEGFKTLKCDFHMHSVFSDGHVLPETRVVEAWCDGLDAIALTDHVENRKFRDFVISNLNKSNAMAVQKGKETGILVVEGAEITRKKPLGHINALFVKDAEKLRVPNELDAIDEAVSQGAYLVWNHPGWPNDTSTLYPVHEKLISQKKIRGVEVFNGSEMYPKVLDWCDELGISYFANSDLHSESSLSYRVKLSRPMTLVFVKDASVEGIKEALFEGKTLAYFENHLAGKENLLKEFVQKSLVTRVINQEKNVIEIQNLTDIPYEIRFGNYMYPVPVPANQVLRTEMAPGTEVTFTNCLISQKKQLVMKLW